MLSTFFGTKRDKPATPSRPTSAPPPGDLSRARQESELLLDAMGAVLQLYARYAFDAGVRTADDLRHRVTGWAKHATIGAPRPGHEESDPPSVRLVDRDWKGLVADFGRVRREESEAAANSQSDLRAVVDAFVSAAHAMAVEEDANDRETREVIERVRWAASHPDTDALRREALAAIDEINGIMQRRRERQQERLASLAQEVRNLGDELEVVKSESLLDALTGLSNRKAFDDQVRRSIELNVLLRTPACLMLVDIDHFKTVNDRFGHPAGDALLRQLGQAHSRTFLRRADFVSRIGGDEFAVLLGDTDLPTALRLAERLRIVVRGLDTSFLGLERPPTVSIGIAELRRTDDHAGWVSRADRAMYAAKQSGRDRVAVDEVELSPAA